LYQAPVLLASPVASGLNLALHYLSGAFTFDPVVTKVNAMLASSIVWLDCLITNVDRTASNTNMLSWKNELWLIDHGASLYFHHSWQDPQEQAKKQFPQIKDHVLLTQASELEIVDKNFHNILNDEKLKAIIHLVPDEWLTGDPENISPSNKRDGYFKFLKTRFDLSTNFVNEAKHARETII
jgi:hypothetical protein